MTPAGTGAGRRATGAGTHAPGTPQARTTTSSAPAASPVVLRPWTAADLPVYREWLRPHHDWHRWDGPYYPRPTDDEADEIVARHARAVAETGGATTPGPGLPPRSLVVASAVDDTFWGTVSWYWESEETAWARMGITLHDPQVRGTGAGTAALGLWTSLLFASTPWRRLDLATWSGNHAMVRVAERLGFTLEGRFRQAREVRGEVYDSLVYGVLRDEWTDRSRSAPAGDGARRG